MKKITKTSKWIVGMCGILLILGAVAMTVLSRTVKIPSGYRLQSHVSAMPEDDTELVEWMWDHPAISSHTVSVYREGGTIVVKFMSVQTASGQPPLPDFNAKARELGYVLEADGFQELPPDDE